MVFFTLLIFSDTQLLRVIKLDNFPPTADHFHHTSSRLADFSRQAPRPAFHVAHASHGGQQRRVVTPLKWPGLGGRRAGEGGGQGG